jgi:hypothetical protein
MEIANINTIAPHQHLTKTTTGTQHTISCMTMKAGGKENSSTKYDPAQNLGTGWSHEGIDTYNVLYLQVQEDCFYHGAFFNQELLLHYNKQRKCNNGMKTKGESKKKTKSVAFDNLNPPPDYTEVSR